jgi:uncharacterized protein involved in exopolysaccharide biosynthesis
MIIKTEDYLRDMMTIFFAQKRIVLLTTLLFTLLAVLVAFFWPPIYASEGTVFVKGKKREKSPEALELNQTQVSLMSAVTKEDLASELNIITSYDVLENTLKRLSERHQLQEPLDQQDPMALQRQVSALKDSLELNLVPSSNIIGVRYLHRDPQYALAVLKQLFDEYLRYRFDIYNPTETESFYKTQMIKFSEVIVELEKQLLVLNQEAGTPRPDLEIENNIGIKRNLEQQLVDLQNQWIEKQQQVQMLEKALESQDPQLFSSLGISAITALTEQVQGVLLEKAGLLSLYRSDSQKIRHIDRQLKSSFAALKKEVESFAREQHSALDILERQIAMLETRLQGLVERNLVLSGHQIEIQRVSREIGLQQQSYDIFMKRWEESKINSSAEANNLFSINILSRPMVSPNPVFPKRGTLIPIGILAGFITGCCFAFVREYFDHTFKTPEDVSQYADLPTIFSIPDWENR